MHIHMVVGKLVNVKAVSKLINMHTATMTTTDIAGSSLEPTAARSSGEGSVPIQCYKCWGLGHTRQNCPPLLNLTGWPYNGALPRTTRRRNNKPPQEDYPS